VLPYHAVRGGVKTSIDVNEPKKDSIRGRREVNQDDRRGKKSEATVFA